MPKRNIKEINFSGIFEAFLGEESKKHRLLDLTLYSTFFRKLFWHCSQEKFISRRWTYLTWPVRELSVGNTFPQWSHRWTRWSRCRTRTWVLSVSAFLYHWEQTSHCTLDGCDWPASWVSMWAFRLDLDESGLAQISHTNSLPLDVWRSLWFFKTNLRANLKM